MREPPTLPELSTVSAKAQASLTFLDTKLRSKVVKKTHRTTTVGVLLLRSVLCYHPQNTNL